MDEIRRLSDPGVTWTVDDVARLATSIRLRAVQMVAPLGFGYLGQALSAAEQVAAFFGHARPGRDRLVCSPGHYVIAPFAAMIELGLLDESVIETYGQDGSALEAIGTERSQFLDFTCGSLAQGLSSAVGLALGDRLNGNDARTYALLSDGEMEEGQPWEAALFAAHHKLDSVIAFLDVNNSQVDGPVDSITTVEPIAAKWESFGWHTVDVDGHDAEAVSRALVEAVAAEGKPSVLICRTSTVHGLDCLPADADGHFIKLPRPLADAALAELTARLEAGAHV